MQYTVSTEIFDSTWDELKVDLGQTAFSLVLYGVYVNLFFLSLYTLSRRRSKGTKLLMAASCMMAVIATTQAALLTADTAVYAHLLQQIVHLNIITAEDLEKLASLLKIDQALVTAQIAALATNILITDCIFLYRCYAIWGRRIKPIIMPSLLMLGTVCKSPHEIILCRVTYSCKMSFCRSAPTEASTAGRILFMRYAASGTPYLDDTTRRRYSLAVKIILESGVAYVCMMLPLAIGDYISDNFFLDWIAIAPQLLESFSHCQPFGSPHHSFQNILPTFTLVYVGLNNLADNSGNIQPRKLRKRQDWRSSALDAPKGEGEDVDTEA
ncbi:hypothetical protein R3P38DRAFT_2550073 [Favolaschia claudopus]|uniref:G protein-coupled receptor n=1 Tax=Favolaschia claudopus TaxID=2862362 RepID=A0AAW0AHV3_9AGAR